MVNSPPSTVCFRRIADSFRRVHYENHFLLSTHFCVRHSANSSFPFFGIFISGCCSQDRKCYLNLGTTLNIPFTFYARLRHSKQCTHKQGTPNYGQTLLGPASTVAAIYLFIYIHQLVTIPKRTSPQ